MRRPHNRITTRLLTLLQTANNDALRRQIRELAFEEMEAYTLRVYQYCEGLNSAYLERTQWERLERVWVNGPGPVEPKPRFTSNAISIMFGTTQAHASMMLKFLYDVGLLARERVKDEFGQWYEYWVL